MFNLITVAGVRRAISEVLVMVGHQQMRILNISIQLMAPILLS